jgi:hypothetical protein
MSILDTTRNRIWFYLRPYGVSLAWWLASKSQAILQYFSLPKPPPIAKLSPAPSHTTFSGTDVLLIADGRVIGLANGFSYKVTNNLVTGHFNMVLAEQLAFRLGTTIKLLEITASDGHGRYGILLSISNLEICGLEGGFTIDDILLETRYNFVAGGITYSQPRTHSYLYQVEQAKLGRGHVPPDPGSFRDSVVYDPIK